MAREPGGPPMPVAVQRHPVTALPLDIVLSDADSPMPTQPLSALASVEIVARVSRSGIAARAAETPSPHRCRSRCRPRRRWTS